MDKAKCLWWFFLEQRMATIALLLHVFFDYLLLDDYLRNCSDDEGKKMSWIVLQLELLHNPSDTQKAHGRG